MQVNEVVVNGVTELSLVNDTVSEDTLLESTTAHDASGKQITGKVVTVPVDSELNDESENAIQNKAVAEALTKKLDKNPTTFQTQNGKVLLTENSEGGNLRLTSPDGTMYMEQDCHNNNMFRCFVVKDGTLKSVWYYDSVNNIFSLYPKLNAVNTPISTIYTGTYIGDGTAKTITIGVTPKVVIVQKVLNGISTTYFAVTGASSSNTSGVKFVEITNTGFSVASGISANTTTYLYIALA